MILEVLGPIAVGVLSGYFLRSWQVVDEAKAAQKKNEKSELPRDVYLHADCAVYRAVLGESKKDKVLGIECPRCSRTWVVLDNEDSRFRLKSCECEDVPWPHFHWKCRTCGYAFYILGKDVKP